MKPTRLLSFILSILFASLVLQDHCLALDWSARLDKELKQYSRRFGKKLKLGVHVRDLSTGKEVYSYEGSRSLTPASVQKLLTSRLAIKTLGPGYKYPTEIFSDKPVSGGDVGNLYVRGYGDPSMVDEQMWLLANELYRRGLRKYHHLYLDDSLFLDPKLPSGVKAYEAGFGALTINHNSYAIRLSPSSFGKSAYVSLTEGAPLEVINQTTTVSGSKQKIVAAQSPPSGKYRRASAGRTPDGCSRYPEKTFKVTVTGELGSAVGSKTYYRSMPDPSYFFGKILAHHLEKLGVRRAGFFCDGDTAADAKPLLIHHSKPLGDILADLNKYSNNVSANQVFYTVGQDESGYFDRETAGARVREYVSSLGVDISGLIVADGSGLSRDNKLSPRILTAVLVDAARDFSSSPDYLASLSQFGRIGTMKKRKLGVSGELSVWAKTGTLTGVSSLAGYLENSSGRRLGFAIILNGPLGKGTSVDIENEILRELLKS